VYCWQSKILNFDFRLSHVYPQYRDPLENSNVHSLLPHATDFAHVVSRRMSNCRSVYDLNTIDTGRRRRAVRWCKNCPRRPGWKPPSCDDVVLALNADAYLGGTCGAGLDADVCVDGVPVYYVTKDAKPCHTYCTSFTLVPAQDEQLVSKFLVNNTRSVVNSNQRYIPNLSIWYEGPKVATFTDTTTGQTVSRQAWTVHVRWCPKTQAEIPLGGQGTVVGTTALSGVQNCIQNRRSLGLPYPFGTFIIAGIAANSPAPSDSTSTTNTVAVANDTVSIWPKNCRNTSGVSCSAPCPGTINTCGTAATTTRKATQVRAKMTGVQAAIQKLADAMHALAVGQDQSTSRTVQQSVPESTTADVPNVAVVDSGADMILQSFAREKAAATQHSVRAKVFEPISSTSDATDSENTTRTLATVAEETRALYAEKLDANQTAVQTDSESVAKVLPRLNKSQLQSGTGAALFSSKAQSLSTRPLAALDGV